MYEFPLEYWRPWILFPIGRGIGLLFMIDKKTKEKEISLFARMLIDVDLACAIPEKILIQGRDFEFFILVELENCPSFCG